MAKRLTRKSELRRAELRQALSEGRAPDAWALARNLLAGGHARDAGVLSLAGVAAFQIGDAEQAVELLRDAIRLSPKDADIHMNLGNVLGQAGEISEALAAYQTAHDLAPDYAEPAFNAGVLFAHADDHTNAVIWYERALERDAGHVAAAIGLGEALKNAGNLQASKEVLEKLVEARPDDAIALTNLAATMSALGDDQAARDVAGHAIECDPGLAAAHYNLGVAEQAVGDHATAIRRYRHALALEPMNAAAALNLGEANLEAGDADAARAAFARALDIDPGFAMAAVNLADLSLGDGNPAAALQVINRFLSGHPGHPSALAFKAIALRDLGDAEHAAELDSASRFIVRNPVSPPDGFADIATFNKALGDHVLSHPTLTEAPKAHATVAGQHSGELLAGEAGPMATFADIVMAGFQSYRRRFTGEPAHPFLDQCPEHVRLSIWGVVMHDAGHQVAHIHPSAWLSGVYYVEVPDSVAKDDPGHAGWIEFGRPPADIHHKAEPDVTLFCPEPGLMILFPSHFYHRTVPLMGNDRRISIAFDVMADPSPGAARHPLPRERGH